MDGGDGAMAVRTCGMPPTQTLAGNVNECKKRKINEIEIQYDLVITTLRIYSKETKVLGHLSGSEGEASDS